MSADGNKWLVSPDVVFNAIIVHIFVSTLKAPSTTAGLHLNDKVVEWNAPLRQQTNEPYVLSQTAYFSYSNMPTMIINIYCEYEKKKLFLLRIASSYRTENPTNIIYCL